MLEKEELEKPKSDRFEQRQGFKGLTQAALKMDAVTSDPSWDTYCSYIQHAINVARLQRGQYVDMLSSPKLVNADKVALIRNEILACDERIRCLDWVITMPAEIKKVGSVAKEKLALMDSEVPAEENQNAA